MTRGKDAEDPRLALPAGTGLQLLQRNYRSKRGEIDLVLQDTDSLVFVEVRYRRQSGFRLCRGKCRPAQTVKTRRLCPALSAGLPGHGQPTVPL